jgi:hypothetical protein
VRTVRLELLRAGPPHNQLLSPLTPYLGISGDSPAGVVHVPYEHAVFQRRLANLRYSGASEDRLAQLRDTGVDVARMLAAVPGLAGAVSSEADPQLAMIHLRITLSASELALLPFELAKVPTTVEGESESWLALQTNPPVCITRHIRTVSVEGVTWPTTARILFITGPTSDIPFDAHRRALEQAIEPFQYPRTDDAEEGSDSRHTHYGSLLTIIEDASLDDVVNAFQKASYTHVHVLAHGAVDFTSKGRPFGLRLRGRTGGIDIVSGERFSTAVARVDADRVRRPFVVTLASCDSGLVADVVEAAPGASFAHTLHQSGIPLVIGSQFPLTKEGSVTVVERFYGGLLRGENPHVLAHQTRSELHARYGANTHDWASLVVYEALPTNMAAQLENVSYRQGKLRLDAALQRVDLAVQDGVVNQEDYERLEADVRAATEALPYDGAYALECRGLQASSLKRLAQAAFNYAPSSHDPAALLDRCCDRLEEALGTYKAAGEMFLRNDGTVVYRAATLHWVLVQQLVLEAVMRQGVSADRWATAFLTASLYLEDANVEERVWAHASLAELALIRLASRDDEDDREKVLYHVKQLIALTPAHQRFPIASTCKQFERYEKWWAEDRFTGVVEGDKALRQGPQPWKNVQKLLETAGRAVGLLQRSMQRQEGSRATRKPPKKPREAAAQPAPASERPAVLAERSTRRARQRPREGAFFDLHMLPAQYGDCLWIEYGTDPRHTSRVLVDCGTPSTSSRLLAKIEAMPAPDRAVELFILTHIDEDHIGGAIPFLQAEMGGLKIAEVWFNGFKHLGEFLSAKQGERFATLIDKRQLAWNTSRDGHAIVIKDEELPVHVLPGGMKLTLLSPTVEKLEKLRVKWERDLPEGMVPGEGFDPEDLLGGNDDFANSTDVDAMAQSAFRSDTAAPNGSSIAVLAEFEGKSLLLAADAHPPVLETSIRKLLGNDNGRLRVGALKVSHHGSGGNTSPELLDLLDCPKYLISTNGDRFQHPHRPAISRIIKRGGPRPHLFFNYVVPGKNDVWAKPDLQERYGYTTTYADGTQGLVVKL